jgi:hypothetical protein
MKHEYYGKNINMTSTEMDFQNENPSAEKLYEIYENTTKALAIKFLKRK